MKFLIALLISCYCCSAAVRTKNGAQDLKTTLTTTARQTELFAFITNSSSLTIACWVKYDFTDAGVNAQLSQGACQGLVNKGSFGSDFGGVPLQFSLSSTNEKMQFFYSSPNLTFRRWTTTASKVQTNLWMHLACSFTYSNSESIAMYVDGILEPGSWIQNDGNAVGITNQGAFHAFVYQFDNQFHGSSFFGGSMSDLAIWTNIVSAGNIFKLAKSKVKYMPLQVQPESIFVYYPMDTSPSLPGTPGPSNRDLDRTLSRFVLDAGGHFNGERTLSYQPNQ